MAAAAVALNLPALDDGASCLADAAAAGFQFESIDDYEMVEEIGEGTFGIVAKAQHRRTGETVAVKWIRSSGEGKPPAFLLAAVREAGCLAACRGHPNIVDLRGLAADNATGDLFLVMEFVAPTLSRYLTRPFTEAETRAAMRQLLAAAEWMHGAGTVHRDIKPDNILVDAGAGGVVLKVCDFGSATPARPLGKPYPERRVGTVQYNAPEQLMGIRCYGTAVDMWALGGVMAELLIGMPLFMWCDGEDILMRLPMGMETFDGMLSLPGREVLAGLLSYNPCERLTAADALKHRWFTEEETPYS